MEDEKRPLDVHVASKESPVRVNHPLVFSNPLYDHLKKGAGQLTPSEASSSPVVSPVVSEKHFFKEPEGSPSHKHPDTPSSISDSTGEW